MQGGFRSIQLQYLEQVGELHSLETRALESQRP